MREGCTLAAWFPHIVLAVDTTGWCLVHNAKCSIVHLHQEVVLEVKETCLTDIACPDMGLADHSCLEVHACTRVPVEKGEQMCTCPAFMSEFLLQLFKQEVSSC